LIEAYLQSLLDLVAASPIVRASDVTLDKRAPRVGLIRGDKHDGSETGVGAATLPNLPAVLQEIEAIHPLML
jgi:hypothetical protein